MSAVILFEHLRYARRPGWGLKPTPPRTEFRRSSMEWGSSHAWPVRQRTLPTWKAHMQEPNMRSAGPHVQRRCWPQWLFDNEGPERDGWWGRMQGEQG